MSSRGLLVDKRIAGSTGTRVPSVGRRLQSRSSLSGGMRAGLVCNIKGDG
jgi:hypothetical protein